MTKVKLQLELDMPGGIISYDLGARQINCRVCGATTVIAEGEPVERTGTFEQIFEKFIGRHANCIIKHADEQRQRADTINSMRGGPGDR